MSGRKTGHFPNSGNQWNLMGDTYNKREQEKKKQQRKRDKQARRDTRKDDSAIGKGWETMMAYVDENGVIQDSPPDPKAKKKVDATSIELGVPKRDNEDFDPSISGIINFYDSSKGYGFIKSESGESFFVHANNISGEPGQGKHVRFEKQKGAKGWVAVKVVIEY